MPDSKFISSSSICPVANPSLGHSMHAWMIWSIREMPKWYLSCCFFVCKTERWLMAYHTASCGENRRNCNCWASFCLFGDCYYIAVLDGESGQCSAGGFLPLVIFPRMKLTFQGVQQEITFGWWLFQRCVCVCSTSRYGMIIPMDSSYILTVGYCWILLIFGGWVETWWDMMSFMLNHQLQSFRWPKSGRYRFWQPATAWGSALGHPEAKPG
jgi:hypothetical protein